LCTIWKAIFLSTMGIPLQPVGVHLAVQPVRSYHRQDIECVTQRFHHAFGSIERANFRQHMGGIGTLVPPCFQPAMCFAHGQEGLQETLFCAGRHQTSSELAQDRVIKSGISQLQAQAILPIKTAAYRVGSLTIRQILQKLEDGDQGQSRGAPRRVARAWDTDQQRVRPGRWCPRCHADGCRGCPWEKPPAPRGPFLLGCPGSVGVSSTWLASCSVRTTTSAPSFYQRQAHLISPPIPVCQSTCLFLLHVS